MKKTGLSKKAIIQIITVAVAVILILGWCVLAFLHLEGVVGAGKYNDRVGTKYIAHRGYSAKYFENSYEAFEQAAKNSFFQGIETDVYITKDGQYVCCHDETPFADKTISVTEHTYEEIKSIPMDKSKAASEVDTDKDYYICLFSDYLKLCYRYRKMAVVEIKQDLPKEQAIALAEFAAAENGWTNTMFCSFKKDPIDYIYAEHSYATIKLFTSAAWKAELYIELGYNISVAEKILTPELIEKAHDAGVFVDVYTINDPDDASIYIADGVDYITTNDVLFA